MTNMTVSNGTGIIYGSKPPIFFGFLFWETLTPNIVNMFNMSIVNMFNMSIGPFPPKNVH